MRNGQDAICGIYLITNKIMCCRKVIKSAKKF